MPAVHTFDELVKYFAANNVQFRHDLQAQVCELPSQPGLVGNLYLRWEKSIPFIQVIQFMLDEVSTERLHELETAIVRLDNTLEVGGFGFNHQQRRLYCRMTIPVFPPDGINPDSLLKLGSGTIRNGLEFLDVFKAVIGGKPGDQVIDIYKELAAQRRPSAPG